MCTVVWSNYTPCNDNEVINDTGLMKFLCMPALLHTKHVCVGVCGWVCRMCASIKLHIYDSGLCWLPVWFVL